MIKNKQERQRIGQRIAELRKAVEWTDEKDIHRKGITQQQLAERSGLQRSHIARLEQGAYGDTIDVLSAIAGALGVTVDFVEQL
jgi:transcriptional regulator with XRE-family HTH domain